MAAVVSMIVIASLFAVLFIVVRVKKGGPIAAILKALASVMFIALGVTSACMAESIQSWMLFMILGMVLGLVGDIVLDLKVVYPESNDIYLNSGMISFGIGHIMFLVAVLLLVPFDLTIFLICLAVGIVFAAAVVLGAKPMKLDYGKFVVHSASYAFILVFMSAFTIAISITGTNIALMAAGMVLFLLSDLVLSKMYFGGKPKDSLLCIINHVLYYGAQICLAASIFFIG